MRVFIVLLLGAMLMCLQVSDAEAQEEKNMAGNILKEPYRAVISPDGGRLYVEDSLPVKTRNGKKVLEFIVPHLNNSFHFDIPGHNAVRWDREPAILDPDSLASGRQLLEAEKLRLSSRLSIINTRIALWQNKPDNASAQEIAELQAALERELPGLLEEQNKIEQRLKLVKEELQRYASLDYLGEKITVVIAPEPEKERLDVKYSYNYGMCSWEPWYEFDARPDAGSGGAINVRFNARISQYTGINWRNTEIVLVTGGMGQSEPAPLEEWIVEAGRKVVQPRAVLKTMASNVLAETADGMNGARADNNSTYANWTLTTKGLQQGISNALILQTQWNVPLQWLARPAPGNDRVWLFAKYEPPADSAWPDGIAYYSVNDQNTYYADFTHRGRELTLYFGADPKVTVRTITDSRKHGKAGLINTEKTWHWAWTYKITNLHVKPIKVLVERPEPQIVDQAVKANYNNKPAARIEEHMFKWDVEVPAGGTTDIEHAVTIAAPAKLDLSPVAP